MSTSRPLPKLPIETHGFYEVRGGYRLPKRQVRKRHVDHGESAPARFVLVSGLGRPEIQSDFIGDLVEETGRFRLREANIFTRPTDYMDVKVGRQILNLGDGDLVFINDLFPKDWESFLSAEIPNTSKRRPMQRRSACSATGRIWTLPSRPSSTPTVS